jgi:hypothetical protein
MYVTVPRSFAKGIIGYHRDKAPLLFHGVVLRLVYTKNDFVVVRQYFGLENSYEVMTVTMVTRGRIFAQ